jgi:hypothetical protein
MNTYRLFCVSLSVFFLLLIPSQAEVIRADSPIVQIEGRYASLADGGVCQGFPGVVTRVRFDGASLSMKVESSSDDVYIDIAVDGADEEYRQLESGGQKLELFRGAPGVHLVEITKRTQTWRGLLTILSFECVDGQFIEPLPLPEKKLMFIGDSITCGEASDIREEFPSTGGILDSGNLSYGKVISRILDAQCHLVSYGGQGIIRDWQGNRNSTNAPIFYERALADNRDSVWDHSQYVPDAIGICLGQNDFSRGIADQDEFVNAYVEFIRKVMRDAPDANVFLIDSPMHGYEGEDGVKRQTLSMYLDKVVSNVNRPNLKHLHLGQYPGRPENAHPIASEHVAIAQVLSPYFAEALSSNP